MLWLCEILNFSVLILSWRYQFNKSYIYIAAPLKSFIYFNYFDFPGVTLLPNEAWLVASSSVGANERTYHVTNLQPARTYQFRVSAVNDVGEGPPSEASENLEMPQQREFKVLY